MTTSPNHALFWAGEAVPAGHLHYYCLTVWTLFKAMPTVNSPTVPATVNRRRPGDDEGNCCCDGATLWLYDVGGAADILSRRRRATAVIPCRYVPMAVEVKVPDDCYTVTVAVVTTSAHWPPPTDTATFAFSAGDSGGPLPWSPWRREAVEIRDDAITQLTTRPSGSDDRCMPYPILTIPPGCDDGDDWHCDQYTGGHSWWRPADRRLC